MYRIMGVDPGSTCTGYGIIRIEGDDIGYIDSGHITLKKSASRYEKLRSIFLQIQKVIEKHAPTHFAIEDVFYSKNAKSSLILGEARGAAILAAALANLPIYEYSPREVKQSVVGHGAADKSQVNFMLGRILDIAQPPENTDESDALAVAVCHAFKSREWSVT
ncbi:MAG: crossover junction endodeoxyribonuclease RuvC [Candidatus Latescibacterota bacterium]|nr:MAG: crossover junction endodeoxyribonuclease RuvC [Candidatus Latescibacterota bacterium]